SRSLLFTHPPTTRIYTLSLHDALPISERRVMGDLTGVVERVDQKARTVEVAEAKGQRPVTMTVTDDTAITVRGEQRGLRDLKKEDRKSTRLNSSHRTISYAVFCLKKKK